MSTEIFSSTHLSSNRVWGQLGTTTATEVLDGCRRQRITGEVLFHAGDRTGTVELRAGSVERAAIGAATGHAALAALAGLGEGTFRGQGAEVLSATCVGGMIGVYRIIV